MACCALFHRPPCSFYFWQLSLGALALLQKAAADTPDNEPDHALLEQFKEHQRKARRWRWWSVLTVRAQSELYHAYDAVHRFIEEPFTSHSPEALFHIARFVVLALSKVCRVHGGCAC